MMRYLLCLALLLIGSDARADRYLSAIAVAIATDNDAPAPAPPSPSGLCDNCGGTGRLGDGTVSVDCPLCVDGKVTAVARSAAQPAKLDVRSGAPAKSTPVVVKQPGPMWYQNGHTATVDHLVNVHGIDRSLAERMTPAQRDIAHSNAHNAGRYSVQSSGCPGGVCPSSSRSRGFRLFRR